MNPKSFISHASEDKERFVTPFYEKLRANGVDAWIDNWEIKIGDSLIQKIFNDGIGKAESVIIILSSNSVEKPWVKEEIDASFVRKVEDQIRLIPIILDNCAVPDCLRHLKYVRIKNLIDYEGEFSEILSTLYNMEMKPSLGPLPSYVTNPIQQIPGLTKQDTIILKVIYDFSINNGEYNINLSKIQSEIEKYGISEREIDDSLTLFNEDGYIQGHLMMGMPIQFFSTTVKGFMLYAKKYIPNLEKIINEIIIYIVNHNPNSNHEISKEINQPRAIIDYILQYFSYNNLVKISEEMSGNIVLISVSPKLKRMVTN